jgi:hypothetical protein
MNQVKILPRDASQDDSPFSGIHLPGPARKHTIFNGKDGEEYSSSLAFTLKAFGCFFA